MIGPLAIDAPPGDASRESHRLRDILPWLAHNAMIHYLAPRGLEQYSGGGWGTRDVCQGPVEMLLALGKWEPMRDLLLRVYKQQNADGDWPQWFMFFERERSIRPGDSHGDIVLWPLLALAQYLIAAEDVSILEEIVPFFHPDGDERAEKATIWGHVERGLRVVGGRVIPGTSLAAYGHGDWNDSLQPVDPAMSAHLCSAWTVTLHHQTLTTLAKALRRAGRVAPAESLEASARCVKDDFHRLLIADGTIPGYVYFRSDGSVERLLHPSDGATGIRFSLLPMIHAIINDLLSPAEAAAHVDIIKRHLLAVDGARLFDRPFPYHGGPQRYFQRAESSTFFGREIGIMYTHAHLRFAEAMAHYGDADAFLLALRQANPIALRSVVPAAQLRQANCYYSSSDAAFLDRYQALSEYERVKTGEIPYEGGWRVYSSGAGIALRLINECLLGIRRRKSTLVLDPMIPKSLDGLRAEVDLAGQARERRVQNCGARLRSDCGHAQRHGAALRSRGQSVPSRRRGAVDGRGACGSHRFCERPRDRAAVKSRATVAALAVLFASIIAGGARGEESSRRHRDHLGEPFGLVPRGAARRGRHAVSGKQVPADVARHLRIGVVGGVGLRAPPPARHRRTVHIDGRRDAKRVWRHDPVRAPSGDPRPHLAHRALVSRLSQGIDRARGRCRMRSRAAASADTDGARHSCGDMERSRGAAVGYGSRRGRRCQSGSRCHGHVSRTDGDLWGGFRMGGSNPHV